MLPRAHLTSCSRTSVTTPLWLYWLWRLFLYSFSVYPCHLFSISSVSVICLLFMCFIVPILEWNSPLISPVFLRSFHCIVFLYFSPLFIEEGLLSLLFCGTLHSVGCTFLFPPCFSFLFFLQLFVNPSQTTALPSCFSFSWGWFCLVPLYSVMDLCP